MYKKITIIISLIFIAFQLGACTIKETVSLIGDMSLEVEVNSNFTDPGINMPDEFTCVTNSYVNMNKIGRYKIIYTIIDQRGAIYKEMTRVVKVVDTTSPQIIGNDQISLYFGLHDELINQIDITDNYDNRSAINVSSNIHMILGEQEEGFYDIAIIAEDTSMNLAFELVRVEMIFDLFYLIEYLDDSTTDFEINRYDEEGSFYNEATYVIDLFNDGNLQITESNQFHYRRNFYFDNGSGIVFITGSFRDMGNVRVSIAIKPDNSSMETWIRTETFDALIINETINSSMYTYTYEGDYEEESSVELFNENVCIAIDELKEFYHEMLNLTIA